MKKTFLFVLSVGIVALLTLVILSTLGYSALAGKILLSAALIAVLLVALRRSPEHALQGKQRFDRLQSEPCSSEITFLDVAANREALESLRELADYIKHPEAYARLGARMPRGILLYGPPGTGKTLLARALAGEAGVPFYSLSGSDFVQMYVGVGASRIRDLFSKARKSGKCVIFIDEIDAMGKNRSHSSSDEREQTLNALLNEMSGFHDSDGILVLAATNRIDTLDPALIRPGRFDRHIEVGLPGRDERLAILRLHCRNKPVDSSVDLALLAGNTVRFSGAALENLMNEAAIRAARRGAKIIEQQDIDDAYVSVVAGDERPLSASQEELATIALHEAGHALASLILTPENRLSRVTIHPSTRGAAGYNLSIPVDRTLADQEQLCAQIQVLLAGRAAEMLINEGRITSGASNDLSRAAELASAMIMDLGMGDSPAFSLRTLQKSFSIHSQDALNQACRLLQSQWELVFHLLETRSSELILLAEELLKRETLSSDEIEALVPDLGLPRQNKPSIPQPA